MLWKFVFSLVFATYFSIPWLCLCLSIRMCAWLHLKTLVREHTTGKMKKSRQPLANSLHTTTWMRTIQTQIKSLSNIRTNGLFTILVPITNINSARTECFCASCTFMQVCVHKWCCSISSVLFCFILLLSSGRSWYLWVMTDLCHHLFWKQN